MDRKMSLEKLIKIKDFAGIAKKNIFHFHQNFQRHTLHFEISDSTFISDPPPYEIKCHELELNLGPFDTNPVI